MAEYDLIDAYLAELRHELGRRRDAEDVLAEIEDHLREVADAHGRLGLDAEAAQRHALGQFGTTAFVTRAFASTGGGVAMATTLTRTGGLAAMMGGTLFAVVFGIGSVTDLDVGPKGGWFAPLATTGVVLVLVGVVGLHLRHRAIYSSAGRVGRWLPPIGLVLAIASGLTWFGPGVFLGVAVGVVGLLLLGVDVWSAGLIDRRPLSLIGLTLPAALVVATIPDTGGIDWAIVGSILVTAGLGIGFAWVGYGLWREQADVTTPPAAAV